MATTSSAIAAAARPAVRLDGLPVDMLAHIATHVALHVDLLALRCVSRPCKEAVLRAAKEHPLLGDVYFRLSDGSTARAIAAWGRVFGSGCRELDLYGGHDRSDVPSPEVLDALRSVVVNTQGRLRELKITYVRFSNSRDYVLELCRASPQLKELVLRWTPSSWGDGNGVTSAAIDSFAMEVSRLCPLLERVALTDGYSAVGRISPAASWQRHFTAIKCLDFRGAPNRYAAIEETVRACARADEVDLSECVVRPALVDVLLRTSLRGRLKKMYFGSHAEISPQTILQCARGFELLTHLTLPELFSAGPEFYRNLVQARPTLNSLALSCECDADDACLRIICDDLSLEHLTLSVMDNLSEALIDIILQSRSAQTLRGVTFYDTIFVTLENMLRFARGCPLLVEAEWHAMDHDLDDTEHRSNIDAIDRLLKSRGGKGMEVL